MTLIAPNPVIRPIESMIEPYYKDEYASVEFDDSIPCVRLTLTGVPRFSEHYQLVQSKRLELIQKEIGNYPKLHMLTDSRSAGPVLDEDVVYFKEHVSPEMVRIGIRFLAIVMPTSKFTQLTIREMTQDTTDLTIKYFESMREAKLWLRKMTIA